MQNLYAYGTDDIGLFVMFPDEANRKPLVDRRYHALVKPPANIATEVAVDNTARGSNITYDEFLCLPPELWPQVRQSVSINAAVTKMKEQGMTREQIESEVKKKLVDLISMRSEITALLTNPQSPFNTDYARWLDLNAKFVYWGNVDPNSQRVLDDFETNKKVVRLMADQKRRVDNSLLGYTPLRVLLAKKLWHHAASIQLCEKCIINYSLNTFLKDPEPSSG